MRDHGGNLDAAMKVFGGAAADWIDLSTGINPLPYSLPEISPHAWAALPTKSDISGLVRSAASAYQTDWPCLPSAGATAGIQMIPQILNAGEARVLTPTYNEHAASLRSAGWTVSEVSDLSKLAGGDLAVVVNPNNPDGKVYSPNELRDLATTCGTLIVDESFCDPHPELSLLSGPEVTNIVVFRSFGKFYGLAGLRLGFVFAPASIIDQLSEMTGPWPVSGPAIEIGQAALSDSDWQADTTQRLADDAARLDALAQGFGWTVEGGTTLFRLYKTQDANAAQRHLANHQIWSRIFPYSAYWIRLGLPHGDNQWAQVERALAG